MDWLEHLSEKSWFEHCPRCMEDFKRVFNEAILLDPEDRLLDEPKPVALQTISYTYKPVYEIM